MKRKQINVFVKAAFLSIPELADRVRIPTFTQDNSGTVPILTLRRTYVFSVDMAEGICAR